MEFECEFCHYDFSGKTELDKHLLDIHETVENIDRFLEKESKIFKNYKPPPLDVIKKELKHYSRSS